MIINSPVSAFELSLCFPQGFENNVAIFTGECAEQLLEPLAVWC